MQTPTPRTASQMLDLIQKEIDQKHIAIRNHATFTTALTDELAKCQETVIRLREVIARDGDRELTDEEIGKIGS